MDLFIHTQEGLQFAERFLLWGCLFFLGKYQLPAFKSVFSLIFPVNFPYVKDCK